MEWCGGAELFGEEWFDHVLEVECDFSWSVGEKVFCWGVVDFFWECFEGYAYVEAVVA